MVFVLIRQGAVEVIINIVAILILVMIVSIYLFSSGFKRCDDLRYT